MNFLRNIITRSFSSLRRKPLPLHPPGPPLPQTELIDEEICPNYNPKRFYPARPGDVLADRYQILVKVGWGISSTVWLARDMRGYKNDPESVVALKITKSGPYAPNDEREIENHIAKADLSHRGRALFRTSLESFEVTSPEGVFSCLAYELMREPMWVFKRRFEQDMIPLTLAKTYLRVLLIGLDYLHTKCKTVHTDLKLENIMMSFEDPAVLGSFMDSTLDQPMEYKLDLMGRPVYRCRNDFGPLIKLRNIPRIVDFGLSTRLDCDDDAGIYPIQPDHYRAPEVILGCGWRMEADIWNLGVLAWDILEGTELFSQIHDSQGRYSARAHIAEMIALLGPPPPHLVARYHSMLSYKWPEPIRHENGKLCESSADYFDGPFFDENGQFLYEDLIPDRKLESTISHSKGKDRESFLSFAKMMLAWLPEERATAGELAQHPFLQLSRK